MPPWQSIDLREGAIHLHRVEVLASLEEGDLVAEVAHMRAAARDDDRVGNQIQVPLYQVAANRRKRRQGSVARHVARQRPSSTYIVEELRPRVLARSHEDVAGVCRGLSRTLC